MGPKNEPRPSLTANARGSCHLSPSSRMCVRIANAAHALSAPKRSEYSERLSIMRTPGVLSHGDEIQRHCASGAEGFQGLLGVWKPQLPLLEHGWLYFGRTTCFQ